MENMAEIDPYRVLGIDPKPNLTDAEIKKAYRKLALKLHPDKRKDSERERAQQEFDQLQKAYDILLDPEARAALENLAKARQATRKRHESQDAKRRKMREDLERRERAAERGKNEEEEAKERLQQELARLRKSFATRRKGYDAEAATDNAAETNAAHDDKTNGAAKEVPEHMYRTLKVVWRKDISDYAASKLRTVFESFGTVEDVVIRDGKKRKGSALVVFATVQQAERAGKAQCGDASNPLLAVRAATEPRGPVFGSSGMDTKPSTATKRPTPPPETGPINAAAANTDTNAPPVVKPLFPGAANASSGSLFPGGAGTTSLFPGGGGGGLFPGGVGAGVGGVGAGVGGGGRVGGGGGNYESVVLDKMRRAQERARIIAQMEAEDAEEAGS
jgi:DnaJ family protein C protein 17